jgi:hypothetical protein
MLHSYLGAAFPFVCHPIRSEAHFVTLQNASVARAHQASAPPGHCDCRRSRVFDRLPALLLWDRYVFYRVI